MPLYLVRWPWLKASLVSARDEDDLLDTLDQVDDAEGTMWTVYRGPVWVDFDVPAKHRIEQKAPGEPLRPDEIVVEDVSRVEVGEFDLSRPGCDHTSEMHERITKIAFPRLHAVLYECEGEPAEDEVKGAVQGELKMLVKADWRVAARTKRTDTVGQIATQLGAPVRQIQNMLRRAGELDEPPKHPSPGKVRRLQKKPRRRSRRRE